MSELYGAKMNTNFDKHGVEVRYVVLPGEEVREAVPFTKYRISCHLFKLRVTNLAVCSRSSDVGVRRCLPAVGDAL